MTRASVTPITPARFATDRAKYQRERALLQADYETAALEAYDGRNKAAADRLADIEAAIAAVDRALANLDMAERAYVRRQADLAAGRSLENRRAAADEARRLMREREGLAGKVFESIEALGDAFEEYTTVLEDLRRQVRVALGPDKGALQMAYQHDMSNDLDELLQRELSRAGLSRLTAQRLDAGARTIGEHVQRQNARLAERLNDSLNGAPAMTVGATERVDASGGDSQEGAA